MSVWTTVGVLVGLPIGRTVAGYLINAFRDGEVTKFEWTKIVKSVLFIGSVGALLHYGADVSLVAGTSGIAVIDMIWSEIKHKAKK